MTDNPTTSKLTGRRFSFRCSYLQCKRRLGEIWPVPTQMTLQLHCYHCNHVTQFVHNEDGSYAQLLDTPAKAVPQ